MIIPTYLITRDLVESLERKFSYILTPEMRSDFRALEQEFLNSFWSLLPSGIKNVSLDSSVVSESLCRYFTQRTKPVISLDRIYLPEADDYLEITRLTDPSSGEVIISERSGKKKLREQLELLGSRYRGARISLADVGAFEGKTILDVCTLFKDRGIIVDEICLGISGIEAKDKISENYSLKTFNLYNFYEWIELRDLLGVDGRNVGVREGKRLIMPYWENIIRWASVPEYKKEEAEKLCKYFNSRIIGRLWQEGYDLNQLGTPTKFFGVKK